MLCNETGMHDVIEFNNALVAHELDPMKFWKLDQREKKFYMLRWVKCSDPVVFEYKGSLKSRQKEVERRRENFFEWIKTTRNYKNIQKT